ncbi:quaternary amine ABC transporter ATP-binding protein [Phaeobacter marinintestinus]|uniref:quaternary amine ABC transporter ATP-binding protein n=1 Tax=Falsiphaeobacter marinintestinus TaxID=1492905 RepID=UPI0011B6BCEE|nr:glycine betaine/L-proline ABC transporter ATP-binding protein [Phaeobacter marinintestinus]
MERSVKLECRGVWKVYGAQPESFLAKHNGAPTTADFESERMIGAVRDANVQVYEGEIFVIMGLSGSGKSTLVRCLSRLIESTAGEINFEGRNLLTMTDAELIEVRRKKMGMVFQHFALLPHLTVLQNAAFPLEIQGVSLKDREARARQMIELVGLQGREDYYPRQLSGGQQQRVGIARSLVAEPDLWFLDEPFSALDPLIRREMQDEFLRLQSMLHKTIVFITHDFDEAIRLADRIAVMKDGSIEQIDTPENLVMNPATPYVEEFTRHIPRAKVMKLQSIMSKGVPDGDYAGDLAGHLTVADTVLQLDQAGLPFRVLDQDGSPVGTVGSKDAVDIMIGRTVG